MLSRKLVAGVFLLGSVFAGAAQADVLYDNGPVNGHLAGSPGNGDAWTINFGFTVSDSFDVSSAATATGFDFTTWKVSAGDALTSVGWDIGTSAFGSDVATGSASPTITLDYGSSGYGYDVAQYSVTGLNVALGAGTYWLTLRDAAVDTGNPIYWDENDGPSLASENTLGSLADGAGNGCANGADHCTGSETFRIDSNSTSSVPEPATLALFGAGLAGVGRLRRRRR